MPQLGTPSPRDARSAILLQPQLPAAMPDVDRYSVHWREWDNGTVLSCGAFELDEGTATDRSKIIALIAAGEWDHVDAIRCGNEAQGTYRNVTREIADDVLQHCIDEEIALSSDLRGWLHTHVGIRAVEDAITEHPYLDDDHHTGWNR